MAFTFRPLVAGNFRGYALVKFNLRAKNEEKRAESGAEGHGDGNGRHRGGRTKLFDVPLVSVLTEAVVWRRVGNVGGEIDGARRKRARESAGGRGRTEKRKQDILE